MELEVEVGVGVGTGVGVGATVTAGAATVKALARGTATAVKFAAVTTADIVVISWAGEMVLALAWTVLALASVLATDITKATLAARRLVLAEEVMETPVA